MAHASSDTTAINHPPDAVKTHPSQNFSTKVKHPFLTTVSVSQDVMITELGTILSEGSVFESNVIYRVLGV